jgi:signal transduction histidine kinase
MRRVREWWLQTDVLVRDLPLAMALFVAALLPGMHSSGTRIGDVPDRAFDILGVVVIAVETLPLILRRRWPTACLALVSAAFAADQIYGYHTAGGTALLFALLSAGVHVDRHRRPTAVVASVAFVALAAAVGLLRTPEEGAIFYLLLAGAWSIGAGLRTSRAAEARYRLRLAETTRIAERTRIAGELHDVVTHHVTAMVVQVEAARYLTAAPERLDRTLAAVSDTGRRAITDLRHVLDLLSPDHDTDARTPSAGDLPALVAQSRRAGQPVEFVQVGDAAEWSGSAELVAYRVVQEALTNALKYDHGARTMVCVHHGPREISVRVRTDGSGSDTGSPGGSGRGLAGLRERVAVLGGEFRSGPCPGGGFGVEARIPAGSRS